MAARIEDLVAPERDGAVVYAFPTAAVRAAAARDRSRQRRRHRAAIRRRRAGLALVAVVTIVLSIFAGGPDASAPASAQGAPRRIVVQPGQTLWEIAARYAPDGVDPRVYVDAIDELNRLGGTLPAGARIRLP